MQDFIKNIWQNQSGQNSSAVPSGPPGMAGSSSNSTLPRVYASSSASLNSGAFSTSQVAPFSSVAQPLDLIAEESDRGSAQILRSAFLILFHRVQYYVTHTHID